MEKKADLAILYHKEVPYGIWDDELWTPLQANTENNGIISEYGGYRDNEGDNISEWNPLFAEITCVYWLWKHLTGKKYAGVTQYRRRFDIHTFEDIEEIFKQGDVIAAAPLMFTETARRQYETCHSKQDLDLVETIVKELYPEYADAWNEYINNGNLLFYSNGFILKEEDYARYCEWLFSILFEFKRRMGWNTPEDLMNYIGSEISMGKRPNRNGYGRPENALKYQSQLCGFLSERLWTLYLQRNFDHEKIILTNYLKMEAGI